MVEKYLLLHIIYQAPIHQQDSKFSKYPLSNGSKRVYRGPRKVGFFSSLFLFLFMCFCYILFSPTLGKFYTGITQESLEERLSKHNKQVYGNHRFTAKASDWELFFSIQTDSFSQARRMEILIKKMKSKAFIKKLKEDPETLQFLLNKTKN